MTRRPGLLKPTTIFATILFVSQVGLLLEAQVKPQSEGIVPKSLAGMKMKYSDLHGHYTYVFAGDGTYSWKSTREHEPPEMRKGSYKWTVTGDRHATLDCGEDEVFTLSFDSPSHAKGTVTDDVRVYSFVFEK